MKMYKCSYTYDNEDVTTEIEKMKVTNNGLRGYIAPLLSWVLRKHNSHEVHRFTKNKLTSNLGSKSNWEY